MLLYPRLRGKYNKTNVEIFLKWLVDLVATIPHIPPKKAPASSQHAVPRGFAPARDVTGQNPPSEAGPGIVWLASKSKRKRAPGMSQRRSFRASCPGLTPDKQPSGASARTARGLWRLSPKGFYTAFCQIVGQKQSQMQPGLALTQSRLEISIEENRGQEKGEE